MDKQIHIAKQTSEIIYSHVLKGFLLLGFLMCTQFALAQYPLKKATDFNFTIAADPLLIYQKGKLNAEAGIYWKGFGLNVSGTFRSEVGKTISGFTTQYKEYSLEPAVRFFPFYRFFNCFHHSIGRRKITSPCFTFKKPKVPSKPNGIYIAVGYVFNRINYNYIPDPDLKSSTVSFPFSIKNDGLKMEIGYQVTIHFISLAIGYHGFISFPKKEGSIDPFGDSVYSSVYPFKYRLQHMADLHIGLNLNFKKQKK